MSDFAKDTNVPINDCISRQDAIDAIMEEPSEARYPVFYAEKIRQLPSAQRKGKEMLFVCSVCGNGARLMDKPVPEYCPWCGARTEKGKNDGRSDKQTGSD